MRVVKRISIATVAALALGSGALIATPAYAAVGTVVIGGVTYEFDNADVAAGAAVTAFDDSTVNVVIQDSVTDGTNDYDVTTIQEIVFQSKGIETVDLGNSVETIEFRAFYGNSISALDIPASVTSIGGSAFQSNDLVSLVIPDTVTSLGFSAFSENLLTSVDISNSLIKLEDNVFGKNNLGSVTIPASVITIERKAFDDNNLTALVIPDAVEEIGHYAFRGNNFDSVVIPASVTSVGSHAFHDGTTGVSAVRFVGAPPTVYGVGASLPSFLNAVEVTYLCAFDESNYSSGFTSPSWEGYDSAAEDVTVSYELLGHGAAIASNQAACNGSITEPSAPSETGWTFTGWHTDAAVTTPFDFSAALAADTTLYAGWEADASLARTGVDLDGGFFAVALLLLLAGGAALTVSLRMRTSARGNPELVE